MRVFMVTLNCSYIIFHANEQLRSSDYVMVTIRLADWRFCTMELGAQFVTTVGISKTPL